MTPRSAAAPEGTAITHEHGDRRRRAGRPDRPWRPAATGRAGPTAHDSGDRHDQPGGERLGIGAGDGEVAPASDPHPPGDRTTTPGARARPPLEPTVRPRTVRTRVVRPGPAGRCQTSSTPSRDRLGSAEPEDHPEQPEPTQHGEQHDGRHRRTTAVAEEADRCRRTGQRDHQRESAGIQGAHRERGRAGPGRCRTGRGRSGRAAPARRRTPRRRRPPCGRHSGPRPGWSRSGAGAPPPRGSTRPVPASRSPRRWARAVKARSRSEQTTRSAHGSATTRRTAAVRRGAATPARICAANRSVAGRIGAGLRSAVAMIAWPRPAEAASVPWSISVQVATASILAIDAAPDVWRSSRGSAVRGARSERRRPPATR